MLWHYFTRQLVKLTAQVSCYRYCHVFNQGMVFSVTSNGWTLSTSVVSWARVLFITEWFLASIDIFFFFNCNVCLGSFTWIKWIINPGCEKHLSFLHCLHPHFENYFRRLFQKGSFLSKSAIFCGVFAFWSWHKCLISILCFLYCGFFLQLFSWLSQI